MFKQFFFTFIFFLSIYCAFSQSTSRARASATVVESTMITKSIDLNFASMRIVVAGSVEMVPKDVRESSSNITLPVTMATFTAVSYIVSGTTAYTCKITVPAAPMEVKYGNRTLIARSLDTDPMLYSESDLLAGVYISFSPMNVMVNYN